MKMSIYGIKCPDCEGMGYNVIARPDGRGLMALKVFCETCQGSGEQRAPDERRELYWERE